MDYSLMPKEQAQPYSLKAAIQDIGSGLKVEAPKMEPVSPAKPEAASKSSAELGKAGILAASTMLAELMKARAMREKQSREQKAETEKTVAESTQKALSQQLQGQVGPLEQLMAAYR